MAEKGLEPTKLENLAEIYTGAYKFGIEYQFTAVPRSIIHEWKMVEESFD